MLAASSASRSARPAFAYWLGRLRAAPLAAESQRAAFCPAVAVWKKLLAPCWNFLSGATDAGAGAAPAAAGTGGGAGRAGGCVAGGLSLFMTASDPKKSYDL